MKIIARRLATTDGNFTQNSDYRVVKIMTASVALVMDDNNQLVSSGGFDYPYDWEIVSITDLGEVTTVYNP
jgi:hypothetical protein